MFTSGQLIDNTERLRRFSLKLTRNAADSEDLVQSTLLRALEKRELYHDEGNLFGWTSRIMFNLFVSGKRKNKHAALLDDAQAVIDQMASPANQIDRLILQDLNVALRELPAAQLAVVRLVCLNGQSYEEAARALGVPIGTIRSRLARARKYLAGRLDLPLLGQNSQDPVQLN